MKLSDWFCCIYGIAACTTLMLMWHSVMFWYAFVWYLNWFFILVSVPLLSFNIISFPHFFFLLAFNHGNVGMCLRQLLYIFWRVHLLTSFSSYIVYCIFTNFSWLLCFHIRILLFCYYLVPLSFLVGVGSLLLVVVPFTVTSPQPGFSGFLFVVVWRVAQSNTSRKQKKTIRFVLQSKTFCGRRRSNCLFASTSDSSSVV